MKSQSAFYPLVIAAVALLSACDLSRGQSTQTPQVRPVQVSLTRLSVGPITRSITSRSARAWVNRPWVVATDWFNVPLDVAMAKLARMSAAHKPPMEFNIRNCILVITACFQSEHECWSCQEAVSPTRDCTTDYDHQDDGEDD